MNGNDKTSDKIKELNDLAHKLYCESGRLDLEAYLLQKKADKLLLKKWKLVPMKTVVLSAEKRFVFSTINEKTAAYTKPSISGFLITEKNEKVRREISIGCDWQVAETSK